MSVLVINNTKTNLFIAGENSQCTTLFNFFNIEIGLIQPEPDIQTGQIGLIFET